MYRLLINDKLLDPSGNYYKINHPSEVYSVYEINIINFNKTVNVICGDGYGDFINSLHYLQLSIKDFNIQKYKIRFILPEKDKIILKNNADHIQDKIKNVNEKIFKLNDSNFDFFYNTKLIQLYRIFRKYKLNFRKIYYIDQFDKNLYNIVKNHTISNPLNANSIQMPILYKNKICKNKQISYFYCDTYSEKNFKYFDRELFEKMLDNLKIQGYKLQRLSYNMDTKLIMNILEDSLCFIGEIGGMSYLAIHLNIPNILLCNKSLHSRNFFNKSEQIDKLNFNYFYEKYISNDNLENLIDILNDRSQVLDLTKSKLANQIYRKNIKVLYKNNFQNFKNEILTLLT